MAKPLHLVNGLATEVPATSTSAGAADAGKLPELGADGRFSITMMPPGIVADAKVYPATEALTAGDYVNIHYPSNVGSVRKADASTAAAGKQTHGFVLDNVASGAQATVYFEAANTARTGLTPGVTYVLSNTTPGGVLPLSAAPTTAGHILQVLGVATTTTEINTEIEQPIVRG